ncbi:MAG: ribonuclease III [Rhodospirillales bacterium]|nr:ribonuclease III [Rhodospirillales bacterium]
MTGDAESRAGLDDLAAALGHDFADPGLLRRALVHSSLAGERGRSAANERLEFLGDRVLGLVIAETLLDAHPAEDEGQIAYRHSALVRKEALTRVARTIGLGEYLEMTEGEERKGGRENAAILADACEAVIAAIYRDGGLEAARSFILRHWAPLLAEEASPEKDAKTRLQEWAQARDLGLPEYRLVDRSGPDHEPEFTVEAAIEGRGAARAAGSTKRAAEQEAAARLLGRVSGE